MIPDYLKQMLESSAKASAELNKTLEFMDKFMDETLQNAPEQDKAEVNRLKQLSQRVVNCAKKGDTAGVNELINNFKNGSKSN